MRFIAQPQRHTVCSGSWRTSTRGRCAGSGLRFGWFPGARAGSGDCSWELHRDGFEIGVDRLVEEAPLRAVQLFAARGKLPALEHRHLVRELLDLELLVLQLAILAGECFDQVGGEL